MFKINDIVWIIKFINHNDPIFRMDNGEYTIGTCDNESKTIYIDTNLKGLMLKKVLCHEIVHAAMFSYDIKLNLDQEELLANIIATYGEEIINITNKIFKKLR